MQTPGDMHKWRRQFVWRMVGFAALLPILAGGMVFETWYFRAWVLANIQQMFVPTLEVIFAVVIVICAEFTCIKIIISTRKHGAEIRRLEKERPSLTLSKLREELQPANQDRSCLSTVNLLQSSSTQTREILEASLHQLVERYRTDLGSTPEELAKLEALHQKILCQTSGK